MKKKPHRLLITTLIFLLFIAIVLSICLGSITIPLKEIVKIILGRNVLKTSWEIIILNYRIPKTITAILVGSGLSVSGLLMQTLFKNPLAGPFVLGISSGASLGVAILVLGSSVLGLSNFMNDHFSIAIAASTGAFLVLLVVMLTANKIRNTMSVLIIGLMFGSFSSAIVNILSYFSNAQQLKQYIFWSFGNLGNISWQKIYIFITVYIIAFLGLLRSIKNLNGLLLGENYAKSLGINIHKNRNIIFIITSLLTGVVTAFSGPIAFVGIAAPHVAKLLVKTSDHKITIPVSAIIGAILVLFCDNIAQLPNSDYILPINAITSLIGTPLVIWLIVKKKKIYV